MSVRPAPTVPTSGSLSFPSDEPAPGLLLAWSPAGVTARDRAPAGAELTIGRSDAAGWTLADERLSALHFRVHPIGATLWIEDLDSTNGTFVGGERLLAPRALEPGSVIRAGHCLFVTDADLVLLGTGDDALPAEMAGRFHTPRLVRGLEIAAQTGQHILLTGESGTGKELCAGWLARRLGGGLVAHNCARFASAEEAESTLFGVARGVFTGVDARAGLLEQADGGVLFLDEVHALPLRVQQSLLRFVEDAMHGRIGTAGTRRLTTRVVFATNRPASTPELAHDLLARLYTLEIPSLRNRVADLPEIFRAVLTAAVERRALGARGLAAALGADHFEALLLSDLSDRNVRALETLAAELVATAVTSHEKTDRIVGRIFKDRVGSALAARRAPEPVGPLSSYEEHRTQIVDAYRAARGNLSRTERLLRDAGLKVNRRWLGKFLRRWGVHTSTRK